MPANVLANLFMTRPLNAALSRGVTYLKLNPRKASPQ